MFFILDSNLKKKLLYGLDCYGVCSNSLLVSLRCFGFFFGGGRVLYRVEYAIRELIVFIVFW